MVIFEAFETFFFVTPSLTIGKNDSDYEGRWEFQAGWLFFNLRFLP